MSLIIPENYKSNLNGRETEKAIKFIKDTFQHEIISALNFQHRYLYVPKQVLTIILTELNVL